MSLIDPKIRCLYYLLLDEGDIVHDTGAFNIYLSVVLENVTLGEDVPPNIAKVLVESVLQMVMNESES